MALKQATSIEEVAGIPGRLTEVFGRVTAAAYPTWGASKNTAKILLAVMKLDPSRRAAMEIKYSEQLVDIIRKHGFHVALLKSGCETINQTIQACMVDNQLPSIIYTEGGFAREGAIIITAGNAVEVADTVISIAAWYSQEQENR